MAGIAETRARVEEKLAEEATARQRQNEVAYRVAAVLTASGEFQVMRVTEVNGTWPATVTVASPSRGLVQFHVTALHGLEDMVRDGIHDCRQRLAGELLGRLRQFEQPDGSWPEKGVASAIHGWLEFHGVSPDADPPS